MLYPGTAPGVVDHYLQGLVEHGFLCVEGSPEALLDAEYESSWNWDTTAGLYHFGIQDPPWLDSGQNAEWMQQLYVSKPPIPLMMSNEGLEHIMPLERPKLDSGLMSTMAARRSVRRFRPDPVPLEVLRDCLFAGLGITGFLNTGLPGEDPFLPLKMTPSGGARNPYEGFVYVSRVDGLAPGIYHYSALDHSLGLVADTPSVTPSQLFAQQPWTDEAAFGILLVANFERMGWKYPHPNAYRVVLMEAGHIGQNIALVAADHSLNATPTGAAFDSVAQSLLGLNKVKQALVYGVFIGHADPAAFELENTQDHPKTGQA
jgi:SagB-type dehydrogenase family enzyme